MSAAAASRDITLVSGMPSAPGVCTGPAPSLALHILRPCWDLPCYGLSCPRPAPSHSSVLGGNCTFQKMAYPQGRPLSRAQAHYAWATFPWGHCISPGRWGWQQESKWITHCLLVPHAWDGPLCPPALPTMLVGTPGTGPPSGPLEGLSLSGQPRSKPASVSSTPSSSVLPISPRAPAAPWDQPCLLLVGRGGEPTWGSGILVTARSWPESSPAMGWGTVSAVEPG